MGWSCVIMCVVKLTTVTLLRVNTMGMRSDMIAGQRKAFGDAVQQCECGEDVIPFSCYCEKCEIIEMQEFVEEAFRE